MDGSCPLNNKNLRLALNYALNRNDYVDSLGSDDVTASARYVLPILPGAHKTFGEEYPLEAFPLNGDKMCIRDSSNTKWGSKRIPPPLPLLA